jgi:phytoene dehydrogenase-like protein
VVVGSGPNGLAAALVLARAGLAVEVFEGAPSAGGGCRTQELTLPGFHHDVCSTIQSMLPLSPFFADIDLEKFGVRLATPEVAFAHPLDGGRAASVVCDVAATARALGVDAAAYSRLMAPLVDQAASVVPTVLAPLRGLPKSPLAMGRFALAGVPSAAHLIRRFKSEEAKALLAGVCAHAMLPLEAPLSAAFGVFLALTAHVGGWPVVVGGSSRLVDALEASLVEAGGEVYTGRWIKEASDLPEARVTLFDTSPRTLLAVAGDRLPASYRRSVARFSSGPGICKVDWALSGPVPWSAEACRRAATVHVGGTFEEVALAEADVAAGRHAEKAVLHRRPGEHRRPDSCSFRAGDAVGVLPRAQRFRRGHDLAHRGSDREVRSGLS